jgi:tetratricopeptide (TPR) repeat protein
VSSGQSLTLPQNVTVSVSDSKELSIAGTLTVGGGVKFTHFTAGNYWSGIDVESGGSMTVNGDITIEYALCGIDFYGGSMTNGTNTVTIQNCSTVGFSVDGYTGTFQNIHCKNCGNYGGILKSGTSGNPVIRYCTVETSAHGTYNSGDVTVEYCDLKANNTGDNVRLAYVSTVDLNGYNKIGHPQGYYSVDNRADSYVYAQNNWWGVNPPLSTFFTFPSSSYIDYSSAQPNDSFSAGVYKPAMKTDPLEAAQQIEFSGDYTGAIAAYTELIQAETRTGWKKFFITSMLRAHDQSDRNYTGLKVIIDKELKNASGYYRAALKFILCDILVREGKYQKAVEGFLLNMEQYKGTSMEVEMLAKVARIYGMNLNDTAHAREYAEMAAKLNPGQPSLRCAFAAAGIEYNPTPSMDRFNGVIENYDAPYEPQKPDSESASEFISVSPNPANPITTITYSIKNASNVRLSIYSINGQKIATLVNGPVSAGRHSVSFDGSNYASGVYFYRFESAGMNKSGKILLLK